MADKDFKVRDLVWAKMKGYPLWPAIIEQPQPTIKCPSSKKPQHFVYFFGSKNFAWIKDKNIFPHSQEMLQASKSYNKPAKLLKEAIEEITQAEIEGSEDKSLIKCNKSELTTSLSETKAPKPKKVTKKRISEIKEEVTEAPTPKVKRIDIRSLLGTDNIKDQIVRPLESPNIKLFPEETTSNYFERSKTPPIDLTSVSKTLLEKDIKSTTDKKIGVIGLGLIGRGIVKNLLHSKHYVTVWNRTAEKCDAFVGIGAYKGETAADVVSKSDIIICCVSDPNAAKSVVFGSKGVLKGLEGSEEAIKSFVEMSSVDPITSQELAEAIQAKGARYLEAPVCGSRHLAEEGLLLVVGAGDRSLFDECKPIFLAFAKNAFYVSYTIGNACRMKLILTSFMGSTIGALAEALTLTEALTLSENNFLEILNLSSIRIPVVVEKGKGMKNRTFPKNTALKYQQKDMRLTLDIGNSCDQPMFVTSAANQVYNRAKARHYSDHDMSAVFFGTK